jgi:uncharacterized membrane protein YdjX (TVP38/TMEM64 family)
VTVLIAIIQALIGVWIVLTAALVVLDDPHEFREWLREQWRRIRK